MVDVGLFQSALLCILDFSTFCMYIRAHVDYCIEAAQDSNLSFLLMLFGLRQVHSLPKSVALWREMATVK